MKKRIVTIANKAITAYEKNYANHLTIREAIVALEGRKMIERGVRQKFEKLLPEGWSIDILAGMASVVTDTGAKHLFAYDTDGYPFIATDFDRWDRVNGSLSSERAALLRQALENGEGLEASVKVFSDIDKAIRKLKQAVSLYDSVRRNESLEDQIGYAVMKDLGQGYVDIIREVNK